MFRAGAFDVYRLRDLSRGKDRKHYCAEHRETGIHCFAAAADDEGAMGLALRRAREAVEEAQGA